MLRVDTYFKEVVLEFNEQPLKCSYGDVWYITAVQSVSHTLACYSTVVRTQTVAALHRWNLTWPIESESFKYTQLMLMDITLACSPLLHPSSSTLCYFVSLPWPLFFAIPLHLPWESSSSTWPHTSRQTRFRYSMFLQVLYPEIYFVLLVLSWLHIQGLDHM